MNAAPYLIEPLVLPASLDAPDAGEFLEFGELSDALVLETWGNPDRWRHWQRGFNTGGIAPTPRCGSSSCGWTGAWWRGPGSASGVQENLHTALLHVNVLREFSGRGIGRALLDHAEQLAASRGAPRCRLSPSTRQISTSRTPAAQARHGNRRRAGRRQRCVRFALQAGYRLEQVERFSALPLPPARRHLGRT